MYRIAIYEEPLRVKGIQTILGDTCEVTYSAGDFQTLQYRPPSDVQVVLLSSALPEADSSPELANVYRVLKFLQGKCLFTSFVVICHPNTAAQPAILAHYPRVRAILTPDKLFSELDSAITCAAIGKRYYSASGAKLPKVIRLSKEDCALLRAFYAEPSVKVAAQKTGVSPQVAYRRLKGMIRGLGASGYKTLPQRAQDLGVVAFGEVVNPYYVAQST